MHLSIHFSKIFFIFTKKSYQQQAIYTLKEYTVCDRMIKIGGVYMKRWLIAILCIALMLSAVSCGKKKTSQPNMPSQDSAETEREAQAGKVENVIPPSLDLEFSKKDTDASYDDTESTIIVFSENDVQISGEGATAEKTKINITSAGTYVFSGSCSDGKIMVTLEKNDKAKLVLNGLALTCKDGSALVITEGDKVFLTLADGSQNSISDGNSYTETIESTNVDAAIFSRADMAINGGGSLTVNANNKHGIVSKDDLILSGKGSLAVNALGVGLEGKDCVKIEDMTVSVVSGSDGIRSSNTEDATRGFVYIKNGNISVESQKDGIQAETLLQIDGGDISIVSGGGSQNAPAHRENDMFRPGSGANNSQTDNEVSTKGLKCATMVLINGGKIQIDACDDGIHSDGDVGLSFGDVEIASGDDGIHAEAVLEIAGGSLFVTKSYEGLEGCKIYLKGGNISVVSSDDGLNASDPNASSGGGFGGMMGGGGDAYLCISGGYVFINAAGDGLDSNGNFDLTGGIVLVSGPTNGGNGALDYGDGCKGTVSGGTLIAVGSAGMAENFTNAENQGTILVSTGSCGAGTTIAICDEKGTVLASFTPVKAYQTAVITCPGMVVGGTYSVYTGATVKDTDGNGFAENSTLSGGTKIGSVELTTLVVGSGGMGGGGGGMKPSGGGGMRPPRF